MSDLFNSLNKQPQVQNPQQIVQQLKSDPAAFLRSRGLKVPQGVDMRNPQSIINGLMQSGQIGNDRFRMVMQMLGRR